MASAGRILIMPKGNYNAETTYEMLDLVFYGGASWVAKKTVVGVAPTEDTEEGRECWMKMCEGADLTEVYNRLSALETALNNQAAPVSLDDLDLSGYALKTELSETNTTVNGIKSDVDTLKETAETLGSNVEGLSETVSNLQTSMGGVGELSTNFSNRNVLDYDNARPISYNILPFTCTSAGEVTVYMKASGNGAKMKIDKNSRSAAYLSTDTEVASTFPVASGDVLSSPSILVNVEANTITFIPYKYQ